MTDIKVSDRHVLEGENVEIVPCNKNSGPFTKGLPDMVVIHYTGGSSVSSAVRTLVDPNVKASAHLVIGQKGEIKQLVPFNLISWHAGISAYQGRKNLNQCSIGIELDNAGRLTKLDGEYVSWFGRKYPASEVMSAIHKNESKISHWHLYTEEQIDAVQRVCELLRDSYHIQHIVGHDDIAPGRKTDPGPAFPLDKLRQRILENDRKSDEEELAIAAGTQPAQRPSGVVTATALNMRAMPNASADLVSEPLSQGTSVEILEEKSGWLRVDVIKAGWVKKDFIRII